MILMYYNLKEKNEENKVVLFSFCFLFCRAFWVKEAVWGKRDGCWVDTSFIRLGRKKKKKKKES